MPACADSFADKKATMNPQQRKPILTRSAAIKSSAHYCTYQPRSQQELRNKLYELGLHRNEVEQVITEMILAGSLNEARFAMAYVSGKFRINRWGKRKIRDGLKRKRVSEKLIQKALQTIDPEDYRETLFKHAEKYSRQLKEKHPLRRKFKLIHFLMEKGFESELITEVLAERQLLINR